MHDGLEIIQIIFVFTVVDYLTPSPVNTNGFSQGKIKTWEMLHTALKYMKKVVM